MDDDGKGASPSVGAIDQDFELTPEEVADFARWRAERDEAKRLKDEQDFAEDMRATRPFRIRQTLMGDPSFTLANTYADFIALLRSGDNIPQALRDTLADALERGQIDEKGKGPRLRIEGDGTLFKTISDLKNREKLLDAGLFIARERSKGRRAGEIRQDLPALFKIVDAEDYEKRAKRYYKIFRAWLEENYESQFDWRPTNDVHSFERVPAANDVEEGADGEDILHEMEDDYFTEARHLFLAATTPEYQAASLSAPVEDDPEILEDILAGMSSDKGDHI